jgi:hypothetical protein
VGVQAETGMGLGAEAHFTFLGSAAQAPNLNLSLNPNLMNTLFDHEKLEVYRESLAFIAWLEPLIQELPKTMAVRDARRRLGLR